MSKKVVGIGAAIYDIVASVSDEFISQEVGEKGGMEYISSERLVELVSKLPAGAIEVAGGSAANTVFALAELGISTSFIGKVGRDKFADKYIWQFDRMGGNTSSFKTTGEESTAMCLSLVTPDSERTLRTCLAAAATLSPSEITAQDLIGYDICHIEGYVLFNRDLAMHVFSLAKENGLEVSYDLGAFEVVRANPDIAELLEKYVDIVYANEDEAVAFSGTEDLNASLEALSKLCKIAVVKKGKEGAMIKSGGKTTNVELVEVDKVVDTTGAGDLWAAGFLYGYVNGCSLEQCGHYGSILGGEAVRQFGAKFSDKQWAQIKDTLKK